MFGKAEMVAENSFLLANRHLVYMTATVTVRSDLPDLLLVARTSRRRSEIATRDPRFRKKARSGGKGSGLPLLGEVNLAIAKRASYSH